MTKVEHQSIIVRAASLYYVERFTLDEIAIALDATRSTVYYWAEFSPLWRQYAESWELKRRRRVAKLIGTPKSSLRYKYTGLFGKSNLGAKETAVEPIKVVS